MGHTGIKVGKLIELSLSHQEVLNHRTQRQSGQKIQGADQEHCAQQKGYKREA